MEPPRYVLTDSTPCSKQLPMCHTCQAGVVFCPLQDNLKDKQAVVDMCERKCQCLEDENFRLREENERLRDELRFLRTEVRHTQQLAGLPLCVLRWRSCDTVPVLAKTEGGVLGCAVLRVKGIAGSSSAGRFAACGSGPEQGFGAA